MHLTAFCDILGTKALVSSDRFTDFHALDFSGAVAVAAHQFRSARFAVFSDCVIFSVPADEPLIFLEVVQFLWAQWLSDAIWVRGGIDLGEITWVDFSLDKTFSRSPNLSIARVYGKAVVGAYEVERSSGPGILPFATLSAAKHLEAAQNSSYLPLASPVIKFCESNRLERWEKFFGHFISEDMSPLERRHIEATVRVIAMFRKNEAEHAGGGIGGQHT